MKVTVIGRVNVRGKGFEHVEKTVEAKSVKSALNEVKREYDDESLYWSYHLYAFEESNR